MHYLLTFNKTGQIKYFRTQKDLAKALRVSNKTIVRNLKGLHYTPLWTLRKCKAGLDTVNENIETNNVPAFWMSVNI